MIDQQPSRACPGPPPLVVARDAAAGIVWSARGMLRSAAAIERRALRDHVEALLRRDGYAFPTGAIREVQELFDDLIAEVK